MPQKKNPDIAELIRGKTGKIYGELFSVLTIMKGLPLAYNRDMQENKSGLFNTAEIIISCIKQLIIMVPSIKLNKKTTLTAAKSNFSNATDMADYLVLKNIPFRKAHEITGKIINYADKKELRLNEIDIEKLKEFSPCFEKDIFDWINVLNSTKRRKQFYDSN